VTEPVDGLLDEHLTARFSVDIAHEGNRTVTELSRCSSDAILVATANGHRNPCFSQSSR
jgi:hypothetical protein